MVVKDDEIWVPNMEFMFFGTPQIYEYYYSPWMKSYMTTLYIAFYLFGVGEVCPRTGYEIIVAINILLMSSIVNGLIIGNMALYMNELHKKKSEFNSKMDTVNTAMNSLKLNTDLSRDIKEFFFTTNNTHDL